MTVVSSEGRSPSFTALLSITSLQLPTRQDTLLTKLYAGTCTPAEATELLDLLTAAGQAAPPVLEELLAGTSPDAHLSATELARSRRRVLRATTRPTTRRVRLRRRLGVAAAAVAALLLAGWWLAAPRTPEWQTRQTATGQIDSLRLPDGSLVVLNGGTQLRYPAAGWAAGAERRVELTGEAHFAVRRDLATQAKFMVATPDLEVRVLGTVFNVNSHGAGTQVFLEEGRVDVTLERRADTLISLVPGQQMRYDARSEQLELPTAAVATEAADWRQGTLRYRGVRLNEITAELSRTYGIDIAVPDTALAHRTFTLALPVGDERAMVNVLARSVRGEVTVRPGGYTLRSAPAEE